MSYIYKYTIPNLKFLNLFHKSLENIKGLPNNFNLLLDDQLSIIFNENLTSEQINILDNFIQNYVSPQCYKQILSSNSLNILNSKINSTVYTTIGSDLWLIDPDNDNDTDLGYVKFVSNLIGPLDTNSINNVTYSIRLYDALNNNVLFEASNITNTNIEIFTIEFLDKLPSIDTILQLQGKVSNSDYSLFVSTAHFVYYKNIC
jgi:hypothetical protein